ncbi:MAG: MBL fold metallo-hydrolase [Clostridia bacterium]|nr:MBL fold metallo-hydrolase [Clostridia bacterium]
MKKTFVTNMPDNIGAFLKASKCFYELGINITRVSYNKAVDSHALFVDVDGQEDKINQASEKLKEIGYLSDGNESGKIILVEFHLKDVPGSVLVVLELISRYKLNISYMSSQENGSGYQLFKMGLYVDDNENLESFLKSAESLCEVKVINYNDTEKVFDNTIFYNSYVNGLVKVMGLSQTSKQDLLVNVNLAMQTLDECGLSPYKTFDSISKFAELLAESKAENFNPRITEHKITDKTKIILIEPDCGSNTAIIESDGERVFVDSGYACFKTEMLKLISELVPDFKARKEKIIVTHADVDHCGLLNEFDQVIVSGKTAESLLCESDYKDGFRERNFLHKPYVNICKILTNYEPAEKCKIKTPWKNSSLTANIEQIGYFSVGELCFEVYEGKGGHLSGETILIDFDHRIAFTGDVFINLTGLTKKQAEYNQYAPILMTSVDTDVKLCSAVRTAVLQRLGVGEWSIFGGHGQKKIYQMQTVKN